LLAVNTGQLETLYTYPTGLVGVAFVRQLNGADGLTTEDESPFTNPEKLAVNIGVPP
jgi:hypothetical protein